MEDEATLTQEKPEVVTRAEHEALKEKHIALQAEKDALEHALTVLGDQHQDLKIKFGLAKKLYQWREGDSKCPPVSVNGVCPACGWHWGSADPHPVSA